MTLPSQPDPPATPADEPVMEDFVFGGIEADAAGRLAQTQARAHGIRHLYQLAPADPLPAEAVSITAQVGPDIQVDRMTLYYTVDGSDPAGHRGVATNGLALPMGRVAVHWEPLLWSYVEQWQVHLPGQPAGTLVQYRIEGWQSHDPSSS
ncbi:MAG TPA: hypothetical protein PKE45_09565, partial [Caldilineaceae bacterium]|nr:hypothetical protein [Caldilineaceae bacterium]